MSARVRLLSGWILVAAFTVGLAGMVVGAEAEGCCAEPCQWILTSACCDFSSAIHSLPALNVPALVSRIHDVVATGRTDVFRVGSTEREPRIPLGLKTTVLRL